MKGLCSDESIAGYYTRRGWKVARMVVQYNRLWQDQPGAYMSSYERLHTAFAEEVRRLAAFIGISISDADIERLRRENCFQRLKEKYDERSADGLYSFYRKGIVGDWKSHLTPQIAADIERIEKQAASYPRSTDLLNLRLREAYCVLTRT
jgi:hypothetical protein